MKLALIFVITAILAVFARPPESRAQDWCGSASKPDELADHQVHDL